MTKIKKIIWTKDSSGWYTATIRKCDFLILIPNITEHYTTGSEYAEVLKRSQYYIKVFFPTSKLKNIDARKKFGLMNIDECKAKAEEIIKEEILSFIEK
jgi:hypothetical protein